MKPTVGDKFTNITTGTTWFITKIDKDSRHITVDFIDGPTDYIFPIWYWDSWVQSYRTFKYTPARREPFKDEEYDSIFC